MQSFVIRLLICSLTMSVLSLFYMAITPLLAKRYSVTGRYYAWLTIVMGLIIPFRPQFNKAIIKLDMPGNTVLSVIQGGNGTQAGVPAKQMLHSAAAHISWWQIAGTVWVPGMIVFLLYHIIRHYRFLKLAARWSENIIEEQTLDLIRDLEIQMGLTRKIGLLFCDSIGSPTLTGFINPCILLPKIVFTKEELSFILKHELVHYKRKDLWYKCFVLIATAIHWFNPVVYLMAKTIDIQCELSCDKEVVRGADADSRQYYGETIISVIRHQSKLKTAFSTQFYGGKKGMKERIFSIKDMSRKKAGIAVLCSGLILTLGTGFAFPANAEVQGASNRIHEDIKEDIAYSPASTAAYRFLPDPKIYSQYSSYGLSISDDGEKLLYNGQQVRLFVDEHSDVQAFFSDEAGILDMSVVRDSSGNIIGIKTLSLDKAEEYRTAFFADAKNTMENTQDTVKVEDRVNTQDTAGENKYEQYSAYGIALSADGKVLNYNGQRVKLFVDMVSDDDFEIYWSDDAGTVNLSVVRSSTGEITAIERISKKQAQKFQDMIGKYERDILKGLDEKIEEKVNERFPEN